MQRIHVIDVHYKQTKHICSAPSDHLECKQAATDNLKAEDELCSILNQSNIPYVHGYSWPDGSLYYYVKFDGEDNDLHRLLINNKPDDGNIYYFHVRELSGNAKKTVTHRFQSKKII